MNKIKFITSYEKNKAEFLQEQATAKYYKLSFWFIGLYFGGHLVVAFIRLFL